ncbi:MAG: ribbon-helix-helix domain-containing protein [Methanomassiliicoccaceae archaeon]|nr:ribbon-helix-helix domain-containing protein [Methanomassiliicoccaceae archaeon]
MNNGEKAMSIRMPIRDYEIIEECVKRGYAMNATDFVRRAAREKCRDLGIEFDHEKTTQVVFGGA